MDLENSISIREYIANDKERILQLLRLNTPKYFAHEEEKDLNSYLDNEIDHYYIIELGDIIAGSGGINFSSDNRTATLSWDILHPNYQGKSLGSKLVSFRIEKLKSMDRIQKIKVRTSQVAYQFYQKQGFVLVETIKDYWAEGFDLFNMEYQVKESPNR
jgi:ribosomal-protein-alanine N-acetyltransferase